MKKFATSTYTLFTFSDSLVGPTQSWRVSRRRTCQAPPSTASPSTANRSTWSSSTQVGNKSHYLIQFICARKRDNFQIDKNDILMVDLKNVTLRLLKRVVSIQLTLVYTQRPVTRLIFLTCSTLITHIPPSTNKKKSPSIQLLKMTNMFNYKVFIRF